MKSARLVFAALVFLLVSCQTNAGPGTLPAATGSAKPAATTAPLSSDTPVPTLPPTSPPATPTATTVPVPTATVAPPTESPVPATTKAAAAGSAIVIDHTSVALFDQLPASAIEAAARFRYLHRASSIGVNINIGLDCLQGHWPGFDKRPPYCGELSDAKYDRSQWLFEARPNSGWIGKLQDFVDQTDQRQADFDALSFLVDYVDGQDGMRFPEISDPDNFQTRYVAALEALEAKYPDKTFVWWTMSLAQVGFDNEQKFNAELREYTRTHDKILFDIADIESHSPDGVPTLDENGREVLFSGYTAEAQSGHLNPEGAERLAKAMWVLVAQLAGWNGQAP